MCRKKQMNTREAAVATGEQDYNLSQAQARDRAKIQVVQEVLAAFQASSGRKKLMTRQRRQPP